jgi:uncharacterized membrane protein YukC
MTMFSTVMSVASISLVSAAMLYLIWFSRQQSSRIRRLSEQLSSDSLTSDDVNMMIQKMIKSKPETKTQPKQSQKNKKMAKKRDEAKQEAKQPEKKPEEEQEGSRQGPNHPTQSAVVSSPDSLSDDDDDVPSLTISES